MSMVLIPSYFNIWFKIATIFLKEVVLLFGVFSIKSLLRFGGHHILQKTSISAQVVDQEVCQRPPPPQKKSIQALDFLP